MECSLSCSSRTSCRRRWCRRCWRRRPSRRCRCSLRFPRSPLFPNVLLPGWRSVPEHFTKSGMMRVPSQIVRTFAQRLASSSLPLYEARRAQVPPLTIIRFEQEALVANAFLEKTAFGASDLFSFPHMKALWPLPTTSSILRSTCRTRRRLDGTRHWRLSAQKDSRQATPQNTLSGLTVKT
jgi:hypothetical protein